MTRAVGDDDSMLQGLQEVVDLFREAQVSVFKLMSSVCFRSVPSEDPEAVGTDRIGFGSQILKRTKVYHGSCTEQLRPWGHPSISDPRTNQKPSCTGEGLRLSYQPGWAVLLNTD